MHAWLWIEAQKLVETFMVFIQMLNELLMKIKIYCFTTILRICVDAKFVLSTLL